MALPHVNYLAVLVSGIAIFILGGLWYSKLLFAGPWIRLMGKSEEELKAAGSNSAMPVLLLFALLCGLAISLVVAIVLNHFRPLTILRGAEVGVLLWILAGATSYATSIFSMQPKALWLINTMYNLVSFILAGIILAAWP